MLLGEALVRQWLDVERFLSQMTELLHGTCATLGDGD
jgi:hypothetical protein